MSSSSSDLVRQRQRAVEVYLPEEVQGEGEVGSSVASTAAGSAASTAPDIASLVEKALAKLPPEMAAEAKDPKRKAKSRDPGWQFGWWPDIAKKDSVQCIFCKTITPSGISRFKQHLAGGYGDAIGCPSCPEIVRRQMDAYIKKNTRSRVLVVPEVQQDSEEGEGDEVEEVEPEKMPSSGTKTKQKKAAAKKKMAQASIAAYVAAAGAGSSKPANQKKGLCSNQLLEWVEQSKLFEFGERDYASRVDLTAKVYGLYKAEQYIEKIPAPHRGEIVYRTLLANCVYEANVKKAEQVFNKMKDLGLPITVFSFNQLVLLYKRVDKKKIADVLAMMEKENVKPSLFSYKLLVDAKGSARDIEGMEKVVEQMETEGIEPDLMFQATIARHYIFDGQREKAEAVLESMEGDDINTNRAACKILLPLYGFLGKSHDVERIWNVCKDNTRLNECLSAIEAFGRLGNVEKAEEVFEDMFVRWKTLSSKYYNAMLRMYANQNLLDKGKELLKRMDENHVKFGNTTLDSLVKLYVQAGEVEKAESLVHKLSLKNRIRPQYTTYLMLLDSYSKKGDIHNSERVFNRLRQIGYSGRIRQYQLLLQAYLNAKAPAYGFKERMKADNIFPNNVVATLIAATDPFVKKKSISDLLD